MKSCTIRTIAGYGIYLQSIDQPLLINNILSDIALSGSYAGIFALQSRGRFRNNHITNYGAGIYLAESEPRLFGNTLEHNFLTGMYLGPGGKPFLSPILLEDENNHYEYFALAGTNTIRENGIPGNGEGATAPELTLTTAGTPDLAGGYNNILDDRPVGETEISKLVTAEEQTDLPLCDTYWGGGTDPSRFPYCSVFTGNELPAPSQFTYGTNFIEFFDQDNTPIDTVYSIVRTTDSLSGDRDKQARAEYLYLSGSPQQADVLYTEVMTNWQDVGLSLDCANMAIIIRKELNTGLFAIESFLSQRDTTNLTENQNVWLQYLLAMCRRQEEQYAEARASSEYIINTANSEERAFFAMQDTLLTGMLEQSALQTNRMVRTDDMPEPVAAKTNLLTDRLSQRLRAQHGIGVKKSETVEKPTTYFLSQNYPNPFNPVTTIRYELPKDGRAVLRVFNILGKEIAILVNEEKTAGSYSATFNATNLPSGTYFYELRAGEYRAVKKLLLLK